MAVLRGRGIPLRVALVAATLVLVAGGLLASGIAVTTILRHDLTNRVDETLLDASRSWAQAPRRMPSPPLEGPNPARPPLTLATLMMLPSPCEAMIGTAYFMAASGART